MSKSRIRNTRKTKVINLYLCPICGWEDSDLDDTDINPIDFTCPNCGATWETSITEISIKIIENSRVRMIKEVKEKNKEFTKYLTDLSLDNSIPDAKASEIAEEVSNLLENMQNCLEL